MKLAFKIMGTKNTYNKIQTSLPLLLKSSNRRDVSILNYFNGSFAGNPAFLG